MSAQTQIPKMSSCQEFEQALASSLAEILDIDGQEIRIDESFSDLGVDSIAAVQWTRKLNSRYGLSLPPTKLFDYPTVQSLAESIWESAKQPGEQTQPSPLESAATAQTLPHSEAGRSPVFSGAHHIKDDRVAIIGIAGQFPMARTAREFWENLVAGRDCVSEIPSDRWPLQQADPLCEGLSGPSHAKWMGVLEDLDRFDPAFFSISPAEAEWMDPQQRLFLQQCWRCLEDAGLAPSSLSGSQCGVFVGCARVDYGSSVPPNLTNAYRLMGASAAMIAARFAYFLNLKGPCISVDTASSSSLVAIAQACDSLVLGHSDLALAGGVAALNGPGLHAGSGDAGMLSAQGRCFSFDARADGFVPAEAIGAVLLKRLSEAVRDGHHIYAVVRGWGVNHDGKTNGITAPSASSQARLQKEVYRRHGIDPGAISLIEAHGTGTNLGDPIEVEALKDSFGAFTTKEGYCALGSAKSNIGHALAAAGVVGVIKAALALEHRMLPPTIHFERLNDHIVLDHSPFYINTTLRPWETADGSPRMAAVNAFGFGGTNAHVVLEQHVEGPDSAVRPTPSAELPGLIVLSARNQDRLNAQAAQLLDTLRTGAFADQDLPDIAYTLQVGRDAMKQRLALIADSIDELVAKLALYLKGTPGIESLYCGEARQYQEALGFLDSDGDIELLVDSWLRRRKYSKLLELWVKGFAFDWQRLYGQHRPGRISLPTYPFLMESYWIPGPQTRNAPASVAAAPLHPLLHRNTSTLAEQRFTSRFTGGESYLRDHIVEGRPCMPAAVFLEMACAAVVWATGQGEVDPNAQAVILRDTNFDSATSFAIEESRPVHIGLELEETGEIRYQIYAETAGEPVVYLEGRASITTQPQARTVDLHALQLQCGQTISGADCYRMLRAAGVEHGPSLRAIETLRMDSDSSSAAFAVANLSTPSCIEQTQAQYRLPISILDAALQAALVLVEHAMGADWSKQDRPAPRIDRIEEITVLSRLPRSAVAIARRRATASDRALPQQVDIELCDESGIVCALLKGVSFTIPGKRRETESSAVIRDSLPAVLERVQKALVRSVAQILRMKPEAVDLDTELHTFGFDSISFVAYANLLNQSFPLELAPTIFFEYSTLRRLAAYLVDQYGSRLSERLPVPQPAAVPRSSPQRIHTARGRWRQTSGEHSHPVSEPLAIVGVSGCFPQAADVNALWRILQGGKDCIVEMPRERWDWRALLGAGAPSENEAGSRWGGFIDGLGEFDPLFFGISPREAEIMDPQQRLIMTHVWKVIEDAGYRPHSLSGTRTALFVGMSASGYDKLAAAAGAPIEGYTAAAFLPSVGPNRMSHFLNLHGPSEPIETACSSALVAIHRAALALQSDQCDGAIVGGVNTILNPARHLGLAKAGMLSPDGHCHTFSAEANGYVRGEGIGMLYLKKLSAAERDGDHIYALIRGTAENHGGRANSLTAPNPQAQTEVVKAACLRAGIDARTINYIETHGTGTRLGDPIEINALRSAFEDLYRRSPESGIAAAGCALGSVKTNIGHLEMAAGIAGFIKIILQLKHRTLVKSLHCREINPYIQLDGSPFFIVRENQPWEPARGKDGAEFPRRAGLSSFGFGGVNAHVVIEEYRALERPFTEPAALGEPAMIVLSAGSEKQLKEQAQNLIQAVDEQAIRIPDLSSVAFTLQAGREAMEHRLAFTASSIAEMRDKLDGFVAGRPDLNGFYRGECKPNKEALDFFIAAPEMRSVIGGWVKNGQREKLLDSWVKGLPYDWSELYGGRRPRRISLPTYPFKRDRYWIGDCQSAIAHGNGSQPGFLHPLLHKNTSDLAGLRFSSTFTGGEAMIADHRINGKTVVAAALQLEMIWAAVERVAGPNRTGLTLALKNIVWVRPLVAGDGGLTIHVRLTPRNSGEIGFEVLTESSASAPLLHSQGSAVFEQTDAPPAIDLQNLRTACRLSTVSGRQCYEAFRAKGIDYGPRYQAIEQLHVGDDQVLARLNLLSSDASERDSFVLHPGLIDSALQSRAGLFLERDGHLPPSPAVLFSLDSAEVFQACSESAWAWVRLSGQGRNSSDRFDVHLMDELGRVSVRLRGVTTRALNKTVPTQPGEAPAETAESAEPPASTLVPVWEPTMLEPAAAWPAPTETVLLIGGTEAQRHWLEERYTNLHCVAIRTDDSIEAVTKKLQFRDPIGHVILSLTISPSSRVLPGRDAAYQQRIVVMCFRIIKSLLALGYGNRSLGFTVLTVNAQAVHESGTLEPAQSAVHGLVGSLAKEQKNWQVRLVDLEGNDTPAMGEVLPVPADPDGNAWLHRAGEWYRQQLAPAEIPSVARSRFVERGIYVVIGGAGAVGVAFTEYLIRSYQAQVIWIGRRPEDEEIRLELDRLNGFGPRPRYLSCDAADRAALERAYEEIQASYRRIHGVIHAAVVIDGSDLAHIDEERFVAALSAKVAVCTQIMATFGREPLDLVVFFSSIQSFEKTPRHSYYAAGCLFCDACARQLERDWGCIVKVMNWGYWRTGGQAAVSPSFQNWLEEAGMGAIRPEEAFATLEGLLAGPYAQIAFLRMTRSDAMQGVQIGHPGVSIASGAAPALAPVLDGFRPAAFAPEDMDETAEERATLIRLLEAIVRYRLRSVGLWTESPSLAEKEEFRLSPLYGRWLEETHRSLSHASGDGVEPTPNFTDEESWRRAWEDYKRRPSTPYQTARAALLERTLRSLPEILSGACPATDVMFPNGSLALVEEVYSKSRLSGYFNKAVAEAVVAYLEARRRQDPNVRLKILEIGAGTGATSARVFEALNPYRAHIAEYCYTDVSPVFLTHAESAFGRIAPYLRAELLDISLPLKNPNISAGAYDLVIAANVLHATPRMHETLRNAKALLKANGWAVINELTENSLISHLTFGLLKGWWLYEDKNLRLPGSPLLGARTWRTILEAEGFGTVSFPIAGEWTRGQQVILAESDGRIRRDFESASVRPAPPPIVRPIAREQSAPKTRNVDGETVAEHIQSSLTEELGNALKIAAAELDPDKTLSDYGLDSILAIQTVDLLNDRFQIKLTTTSLFDHPSIRKLTAFIFAQYGESIGESLRQSRASAASLIAEKTAPARLAAAAPANNMPWTGPRSMNRPRPAVKPIEPANPAPLRQEPIAVVGMSGRFAKADSPDALWEYLATGTDLTEEVSRWDISKLLHTASHSNGYCTRGGFLQEIDRFDPLFFNISGIEATYMDPQQRIFLEEAWKALEDGGYAGPAIEGRRCGVYAGYNGNDYARLIAGAAPAPAMWGNVASILSARIAYYLDLQGPAITVDTACSSSLVACHLACQALWAREIDFALAGGVYVQCTPGFFISATRAGMLSPHGRCHTFDARADGFVPGEGVGVVLLKRLSEATAAGDHIYGVIRGSAINQDGATSGITAPSALSQERLEREVYERFDIQPDHIQMVEAHGTGTKLGDPIEFHALTNAFRKSTDRRGFCALGSIKTNIGHTTAAAGVAGMIKVLLSLKHAQIPPSLHYKEGNPQIDFDNSPFYVNTALRDWRNTSGTPRMAAVSAFGLSGTNAHMVIEEAPALDKPSPHRPGRLIVLSAQTAVQLRQQAERLLDYCERTPQADLGGISHTLLTGRKHFAHRLAAMVCTPDELKASLGAWLQKGSAPNVYLGELKQRGHGNQKALVRYGNQCIAAARDTEDAAECIESLGTIADLFVQGYQLDYGQLFAGQTYRRIPLPTYPFARERYWVPDQVQETRSPVLETDARGEQTSVSESGLHPLVHAKLSELPGFQYRSTFAGDEFFFSDHQVRGVRVLPGMAYLEMVRAALSEAHLLKNGPHRLSLQHVAFVRPLAVTDGPVQIRIELSPEDTGTVKFAIYSGEGAAPAIAHCIGRALPAAQSDLPRLDIAGLRTKCERSWSSAECYAHFAEAGLTYGPGHRALEYVAVGADAEGGPFALAEIQLPAAVGSTKNDYLLHPSVMDAALQASVGFGLQRVNRSPLSLPFAVERLEMFAPTPERAIACVRERPSPGASTRTFDLDVCGPEGQVCVRLIGITARAAPATIGAEAPLLWKRQWRAQASDRVSPKRPPTGGSRCVLFYAPGDSRRRELFRACVERMAHESPALLCRFLSSAPGPLDSTFTAVADDLLAAVQQILRSKDSPIVECQVVVAAEAAHWLSSAVSALLKTARLEDPKVRGQVIAIQTDTSVEQLMEILENERSGDDELIRYEAGVRLVNRFEEMVWSEVSSSPWKDGGVYLITGGTGGLGPIFAREIAQRVKTPILLLTGRSALDETRRALLASFEAMGAHAEYRRADVTVRSELEELVADVMARWGRLNGILHCAGVLRDSFLVKKTPEELHTVLGPKVAGMVHLDEITQKIPLDFIAAFSSASSVLGAIGQADYAMANAFLDGYAAYRSELAAAGHRQGRMVSINWPWWAGGGMQLGEASIASMSRRGLKPLSTEDGLAAFYQALAEGNAQVLVLAGKRDRIKLLLEPERRETSPHRAVQSLAQAEETRPVRAGLLEYLRKQFAETLQLPLERIDPHAPLDQYGIDSVVVLELTSVLEQKFGALSKTLLFEYQTLDALAGYFVESCGDRLSAWFRTEPEELPQVRSGGGAAAAGSPAVHSRGVPTEQPSAADVRPGDIAIIGVSGRYPKARDLDAYWELLRAGTDCVTEIPAERWDYRRYFEEEKGRLGKTYTKWGGFLDGVDEFDPLFFNLSPRDAELLDPQARLFLQCAYESLEDAGYTREALSRRRHLGVESNVGVFAGVMYEEYQLFGVQDQAHGQTRAIVASAASIANRVSYFLNLHGPSVALDTMCSSSLTALHLACRSLMQGECEFAIAGGVNVSIHPNKYLILAQGRFASSTGQCRSFGAGGDGYVPSEGVGAVFLKPLARAIADRDRIHAVIKGTAANHGGRTHGYTVPNPAAQAQVVAQALEASGVLPRAVSYIEAHGTGTPLGDPIEISGLCKAFQTHTMERQFCAIGSVKSNIGHAESAAGMAGIAKVLLQMRHGMLAPSLHAEELNPYIEFASTPFFVQRDLAVWKRPKFEMDGMLREYPRIAGVSSFGAGGSNAHVVLAEYILPAAAEAFADSPGSKLIVLSARSAEQLAQQARNLLAAIETRGLGDGDLPSLAYTLQVGREAFEHRLALTALSMAQLKDKLRRFLAGEADVEELYQGEVKRDKEALTLFATDQELQEDHGDFGKLLNSWVKGLMFDWTRLYPGGHPYPMSLPTYPFLREKYWVTASPTAPAERIDPQPQPAAEDVKPASNQEARRVLSKQWERAPHSDGTRSPQRTLILAGAETYTLASRLALRLPAGEALNIDSPRFSSLIAEIEWPAYDGWIDVVGCGDGKTHRLDWISGLQQWIENGPPENRLALCVTRGLEDYRNSQVNLAGASRAGLYRMLQSEYRRLRSRHMDVEPEAQLHQLVEQIVGEFSENSSDVEVCYRSNERYRARLDDIDDSSLWLSEEIPAAAFPTDCVLWITGGTRGIGYECAKHFVRRYGVKRLLLTGREEFPPRRDWDSYRDQDHSIARKIRSILALEAEGAAVAVSSAPLTDESALRRELAGIQESLGPLGGILHCAGLADLETPAFIRKTAAGMERVMAPKVAALDTLLNCVSDKRLHFIVLFSSVSAIIPTLAVSHSDYAAANAYMDYVATKYARTLPIVSVQWGSWKESGFGEAKGKAYQQLGLLSQTNAEALDLLDRVLARRASPVVMPVLVDPQRWQPQVLLQTNREDNRVGDTRPAPASNGGIAGRFDVLRAGQKWLSSLIAAQLKLDPARLDADTPLGDYGVDSVMLVQLLRPIGEAIGAVLDPSILFEYPTVATFARWLAAQHGDKFAAMLRSQAETVGGDQTAPRPSLQPAPPPPRTDAAEAAPQRNTSDIAVVGLSCRFPGARNLEEYWQLLSQGRVAIAPIANQRGLSANGACAGLLDDVSHFDPGFFLLSQADARAMDPQALLVMEESLNACHHAGYSPQEIKGARVGVYVGGRTRQHVDALLLADAPHPTMVLGQNYLAANVSRFLDLRGPSLVVDTACSSALAAMHIAIQSLLANEITAALVGGVGILDAGALRLFERRGLLNQEPHFHLFDRRAGGTVLGEGVAMVMLKTLQQAQRDGDSIYAIVKGIAVNNDGRTASPSAPNVQAQKEVMQQALQKAALRAEDVGYIEVSGSGSQVTDLLELKAIQSVYRPAENRGRCELGSIKPNIGHPLAAEGIASFVKVALMLHHGQFVPFLSAQEPMPHFDLSASPFSFSRALVSSDGLHYAAINSFADGGTNVHVIVGAADPAAATATRRQPLPPPSLQRIDLAAVRLNEIHETEQSAAPAPKLGPSFWTRLPTPV